MEYIELKCSFPTGEAAFAEIIMARLAESGFESFAESEDELLAYIPATMFNPEIISQPELWPEGSSIDYSWQLIADQNWNALWESNFEPVTIANKCHIRAPFHPPSKDVEFEIVIEPKMSFGTAHHETTAQMIEMAMNLPLEGKTVLDMGCGTGVLAILAALSGAKSITAIDNDDWAYKNTLENIERNKTKAISVYHGDATLLSGQSFDIILANINRNILLNDMETYRKSLNPKGMLLMSGFYTDDLETISAKASSLGLKLIHQTEKNRWVAARFE